MQEHKISMLGTGLIGMFYTMALNGGRGKDRVQLVYSRSQERASAFADEWGIPQSTTDLAEACTADAIDTVVIGLPNHIHEECVDLAAAAGKAILCTKPLGRTAAEAKRMMDKVEATGVFGGYLEDLCYTPKTLKAIASVENGALGEVTWACSRETHPGPHSDWFWDLEQAGGGAIVDLGCHCIEIVRSFIGKDIRPVEVMCWADTLVHPIDAEDNGIALIRFENGAIGQFEVSWTFRGGMDLRDEVAGTEGTIWLNHFLRTGYEMYTSGAGAGYVAEKAEAESGWLFPVGDEVVELGYSDMFDDMFNSLDEGREPRENFYDGYVVNAVIDACYRSASSRQWEPVELEVWRGRENVPLIRDNRGLSGETAAAETDPAEALAAAAGLTILKRERMPGGQVKVIMKNEETGELSQEVIENA